MEEGHFEVAYKFAGWQPVSEQDVRNMIVFNKQPIAPNVERMRRGIKMVTRYAEYRWQPGPAPMLSEMVDA